MKLFFIERKNAFVEAEELKVCTYADLIRAGYDDDFLNIYLDEEQDNYIDKGSKAIIDIQTEFPVKMFKVEYVNGNNFVIDIFDENEVYDSGEGLIDRNYDKESDPLYAYHYFISFVEGLSITECYQSNVSGGISPYYYIDDNF